MSIIMKMVIPLLDENITKTDISTNANFVGAFTSDINRPTLDSHIFLVYKEPLGSSESIQRYERFKKCSNLYSTKLIYIKEKPYLVYTFPRTNMEIRKLLNGELPTLYENIQRILKFWNVDDEFINKTLFYRNALEYSEYKNKEPLEGSVPEKDYAIKRLEI